MRQKQTYWKPVLRDLRFNLAALGILVILLVMSLLVLRTALLQNARDTGTALSGSYAAEAHSSLQVYETLLSFGSSSLDARLDAGDSQEEILDWMARYFQRLEEVLGADSLDLYAVVDGTTLAVQPWEGDREYDVFSTEWYQRAAASPGQAVFTGVYTDAIYHRPVITASQMSASTGNVLAFDIFPEQFRFQFDPVDLSEWDSFFLCDGDGTLIYQQTNLERPEDEIQAYVTSLVGCIRAGDLGRYGGSITDLDGNRRAVYYVQMENDWFSIVTTSYAGILGELGRFGLVLGLMLLLFLLTLAAATWRSVRFNARIQRTDETIRALSNSYYALYRLDFEQGTYEMIKSSEYVRGRLPQCGAYEQLLQVMGEVIEPEAHDEYMHSFSLENLQSLVTRNIKDFGGDFLRRFGSEYRWVNVRVLFDASLAPGEAVLSFREVDQDKQGQLRERRLLEDALEVARKNERAKQTFFSSMSHDMRTPLNAIIGLSALAQEHAGDREQVSGYLEKIQYSSRQLLGLINDILDMSRLEQGKLEVNNEPIDLQDCVEQCLEPFRLQAGSQGKTLSTHILLQDRWVLGDPFRIGQVLNNLLSNAFKFTSDGDTVSVSLEQLDRREFSQYKFVISDTGVGMSSDFLPHLFEPYSREMRFGVQRTVGTGLGMSITQNLVTQMNGQIHVESQPGQGSTFTIILPFAHVQSPAPEGAPPVPEAKHGGFSLEGRRVLLAEDNPVNMEIAQELLTLHGVQVTPAWNGREAAEQFEASPPGFFDAILMDMQMPEMDGCQAARRIRALPRSDARTVPIVAVTANAFAEDVSATAAAGMDAHVSKPIDIRLLCQTLERLLRTPRAPGKENRHA